MARIRTDWRLLGPLLAANVAGMVGGWYYYYSAGQFDPHSPYFVSPAWWPLVSDSPNAVSLFFVAALAGQIKGWRSPGVDALACALDV